jgi:hypothetical protein
MDQLEFSGLNETGQYYQSIIPKFQENEHIQIQNGMLYQSTNAYLFQDEDEIRKDQALMVNGKNFCFDPSSSLDHIFPLMSEGNMLFIGKPVPEEYATEEDRLLG